MFYLHEPRFLSRLRVLTYPLPVKLIPWLMEQRGLGIWVLPQEKEKAEWILHTHLRIEERELRSDGRPAISTAHYRRDSRLLILPSRVLDITTGENIVIHEIGHALDNLFLGNGKDLSNIEKVTEFLRADEPLTDYCRTKYEESGRLVEQFAVAFAAYFCEPEVSAMRCCINHLDERLIVFFRTILKRFE